MVQTGEDDQLRRRLKLVVAVSGRPCSKVDTAPSSSNKNYDGLDEMLSVIANQGGGSTAASTRIAGMISALVALMPMYKLANLAGLPIHTPVRARLKAKQGYIRAVLVYWCTGGFFCL